MTLWLAIIHFGFSPSGEGGHFNMTTDYYRSKSKWEQAQNPVFCFLSACLDTQEPAVNTNQAQGVLTLNQGAQL